MDLPCPKCGEPWDNDEFHALADEFGETYRDLTRRFQVVGCSALRNNCSTYGDGELSEGQKDRAMIASAMYDLLGDDLDGAAAMLDDYEMGF